MNNLNWKDGWGAASFGAIAATTVTGGVKYAKSGPQRAKEV